MITLRVQVPYASFRRSYARSFAESYPFPPPATVYGMLLSLVGEKRRARHAGVALAFAYARAPKIATTLRKLSRYKYGVAAKQGKLGNAPDFVETLCGIDFVCWMDSRGEVGGPDGEKTLESRVIQALRAPAEIDRTGLVCLGLSDDAVDDIALVDQCDGAWRGLWPSETGEIELPVWVDHVGSLYTRWRRFSFEATAHTIDGAPPQARFVSIVDPRPSP